jgi:hypothetical protein
MSKFKSSRIVGSNDFVEGRMSDQGGSILVTEEDQAPEDAPTVAAEVRPTPPQDMFVGLEEQLANVRRWNEERGWGFGPEDLEAVDLTPRVHQDPLVVDVLAVYLPADEELDAVRRTCDELWSVIAGQHPNAWCWDEKCWDLSLVGRKQVRVLHGIVHQPGIRRVTLDLGAHWSPWHPRRSIDVRGRDSAHAEVLAAGAHFPRWLRAMDGVTVPYVLLSGYQVTLVEQESWRRLPCLSWNESRSTVSLTAHWADIFAPRWSSPVCVSGASVPALDTPGSITWAPMPPAPGPTGS